MISPQRVILAVLVLGVFVGVLFSMYDKANSHNEIELKLASTYGARATEIDPAVFPSLTSYQFISSLYSRLVYFADEGDLKLMAAEAINWRDGELRILVKKWKTVDGFDVSAKDAEFSLKRLFILDSNAHGFLKDILCPGVHQKSPFDVCPGIRVEGDELVLTAADSRKKTFILPLLASADYVIIPIAAVDIKSPKLPIVDYRNTSGPYYCLEKMPKTITDAKWNPGFFWERKNRASTVKIVTERDPLLTLQHLKSGVVDVVPKEVTLSGDQIRRGLESDPTKKVEMTHPIKQFRISFFTRSLTQHSAHERLLAAQEAEAIFRSQNVFDHNCSPSETLIPSSGDGDLNPAQKLKLRAIVEALRNQPESSKDLGKIKKLKIIYPALRAPNLPVIYEGKRVQLIALTKDNFDQYWDRRIDELDGFLTIVDSAFNEDVSLVAYEFSSHMWGHTPESGRKWIDIYMTHEEKAERLELFRELHFNVLSEIMSYPICMSPYYVITNDSWESDASKFLADNPWWMFHHKN